MFFLHMKKRSAALRQVIDRMIAQDSDHRPDPDQGRDRALRAHALDDVLGRRPLVEAMESVAGATGNIVYEKAVLRMRDEVATGQRLQRAMENPASSRTWSSR